jgi:hypothetical protein
VNSARPPQTWHACGAGVCAWLACNVAEAAFVYQIGLKPRKYLREQLLI